MKKSVQRRSERGIILFMAVTSLAVVIPMVGLAVDVGYLYACKARLQAAVDGASLAAARALVLGATTDDQKASAKQNAVNWFYSNFPPNNWRTSGTIMSGSTVNVYDSLTNPSLRNVEVTATTNVPTYFMKWFNFNSTTIVSQGFSNRRDVVVMMVLDRSTSMNTATPGNANGSCDELRDSAKLFTGQFAAGRDRIGMVSFSDGTYYTPTLAPSTNFRTNLGFNTGSASGTGAIDNIVCNGGTGTAGAVTIAYNELIKTNLPGAFNVLLVETDGLPNTLALDFWDETATNKSGLASLTPVTNGCLDISTGTGHPWTKAQGGWATSALRRNWSSNMVFGGFLGTINASMIGSLYSTDPDSPTDTTGTFLGLANPLHTSATMGIVSSPTSYFSTTVNGCRFASTHDDVREFTRIPRTDIFGNDVKPANNYLPVTMVDSSLAVTTVPANQKYLQFVACTATSGTGTPPTPNCTTAQTNTRWLNYHNGAMNATDHAAFRARAGTIPTTIYMIGLGGNGATDYKLMQRMANDSLADQFNSPALYPAYTMPTSFDSQYKGTLVYSSDYTDLRRAFLKISSQILRLSQ